MSRLSQEIESLVLKNLPDESHFIVDIKMEEKSGKMRLLILIDADQGVTIDTCAKVSRSISEELESSDLIEDAFILEVSSPGLDFPLSSARQYRKNIDRDLKVLLNTGSEVSGKLIEVLEDSIKLLVRKKEKGKKATEEEMLLPFTEIKKSIVQVSFK
jgi:ribosome maturation factor RimP